MFNENKYLAKVIEVDGNKRAKVQFLEMPEIITDWILVKNGIYGAGIEGQHTKLGVNDIVIVEFFDNAHTRPYIDGKFHSSAETIEVDTETTFYYNGHKLIFNEGNITIEHEDGATFVLSSNEITFNASTNILSKISIGGIELVNWLNTHVHTGNLSLPTSPPTVLIVPTTTEFKVE